MFDHNCALEKEFDVNKICFKDKDICQFLNYLTITYFHGTKLSTIICWKYLTLARGTSPQIVHIKMYSSEYHGK